MSTLISALISAVVSLLICFISLTFNRKKEKREAHRTILINDISVLSSKLYSLLSFLKIYQRKFIQHGGIDDSSRRWLEDIERVKTEIIAIRLKLRYPFNDILINELKCFTKEVTHAMCYVNNQSLFDDYFMHIDQLRDALDNAIWNSYITGEPPSDEDVSTVQKFIVKIKLFQDRTKDACSNANHGEKEPTMEKIIESLMNDI